MNELYDKPKLAGAVRGKRGRATFRAAGAASNIDIALLSRVESQQTVSLETVVKLAKWIGVPVDYFLLDEIEAEQAAPAVEA